jgi:FolB domain-containing protein
MLPNDEILIQELELLGSIGVSEEERSRPQRLVVSVVLRSPNHFGDLGEDLSRTVDYAAVCAELQRFVAGRRCRLIESLAHEMAEHVLRNFGVPHVELELRKYVLPETRYVGVRIVRERPASR